RATGFVDVVKRVEGLQNLNVEAAGDIDFESTISVSGNVGLRTTGNGAIATAGITTTGNLTFNAVGAVTQTGPIAAQGLELVGAGPFTLTEAANHVATLAGNTTGGVSYRDNAGFAVGTVNGRVGLAATNASVIVTGVGGIAINAGVTSGTGNISIDSTTSTVIISAAV